MTSQGNSRSGRGSGHDASAPPPPHQTPPQRSFPGPKLQVQRSLSRDTITIHFSALGKEGEEEDEELYGTAVESIGAVGPSKGQEGSVPEETLGIATALEASEELLFEAGSPDTTITSAAADLPLFQTQPVVPSKHSHTQAVAIVPASPHPTPPASSSWPSEKSPVLPHASVSGSSSSSCSSPSRSAATLSSSKPFLSLVRSLSNDVESKDTASALPPPPGRHRHLMKSFVKSLSTDTSKPDHQEMLHPHQLAQTAQHQRPPESRRNMQLFKQFSQPRLCTPTPPVTPRAGGDSKTAPSSPLPSPDGRSFFKVQEVEARIEDTKRRLSEVMCEPLQLLSKIMGDEGGTVSAGGAATFMTPHRSKLLSSSASELSTVPALNGHAESNNNYSIKEEEGGELEEETPTGQGPDIVFFSFPASAQAPAHSQNFSPPLPRSPSLGLGRCTMSALVARQEEEDFCELYSEDFELCTDEETPEGERPESRQPHTGSTGICSEVESEVEEEEELSSVPMTALVFLTQLVYLYLVLPVPSYMCAVVQGVVAGFMLAILVLWLSAPGGTSYGLRKLRRRGQQWNVAQLDIKEPGVFKGWMNEIQSYDPETYHATLTHSVYVRLEGATLRLSKPNRNIARRATHNEPKPDVTYISQKIYDLADSKIHLVPQSLARKRVWNKKYPICIQLAKQDDFMAKAQGERSEPGEERGTVGVERLEGAGVGEETRRLTGGELTLYLFGRTGREKEEWFRRILMASRSRLEGRSGSLPRVKSAFPHSHSRSDSGQTGGAGASAGGGAGGGLGSQSRSSSRGSLMEEVPPSHPHNSWGSLAGGVRQKMLLDYSIYMAKYVSSTPPLDSPTASTSPPALSPTTSPRTRMKLPRSQGERAETEAWVNALLGRIFWDFLGEKYWADMVSKKIQMKLSKIRLPYFMNELTLTELDMGVALPKIHQASKPSVDHQGLWFYLEVSYTGSFLMTLETKMNLARLGKEGEGLGEQGKEGPRAYCLADSDEESSSAGSSDEEDPPELLTDKTTLPGAEGYVGGHRPSKIMRFVDKIAKSKYFQKATETEFIKKRMEEVSNTPLLLTVEVQECRGTLAVNIPPPPTDRIWYGFRSPPHLELKARPKLGEREVTLAHVTDWIEKKLDQEFQKIFVMPNMDDVWLPIMHSAMDTRSNTYFGTVTSNALRDMDHSEPEVSDM
ncbi:testis-expressed protein 2 [Osmerus eperlanus]|uniref:testis-expressed protein 2 n=1 Tax=Osmerus eperlanus TaxID=29151 RepID=UPI002E160906